MTRITIAPTSVRPNVPLLRLHLVLHPLCDHELLCLSNWIDKKMNVVSLELGIMSYSVCQTEITKSEPWLNKPCVTHVDHMTAVDHSTLARSIFFIFPFIVGTARNMSSIPIGCTLSSPPLPDFQTHLSFSFKQSFFFKHWNNKYKV